MKVKRICAAVMATVLSLGTLTALTGCSSTSSSAAGDTTSNGTAATGSASTTGSGATIQVYTNRTDRVDDGSLDKLTDAFEKQNNCTVKYVGLKDYSNDIKTKMTTKDYGDVLMIPDEVATNELANYFVSFGKYDDLKDTYSWVNKKMGEDKTVYGIPYAGTATGILYNKKVWNDAGVTTIPKTSDEFINDLKTIKSKNSNVVPYYTEYKDAWTMGQWDGLVISASGDPAYKTNLLKDKKDLFDKDGGYYKVYKMMYDLYSNKDIIEKDHATTDWEKSKQYFADGKIGAIVLGSWAIDQFKAKAKNADDIGYMPVPITAKDGKQYSQTAGDYCMGVSKYSKNIDLAKKYVEWFVKESGFATKEGMIETSKEKNGNLTKLPDNLSAFKDCTLFEETVTPDEYIGKFDAIDKKSDVGTTLTTADNFKFKLADAAFKGEGSSKFDSIISDVNKKWSTSRDAILK